MKITVLPRPMLLTFLASGTSYPITADAAQRIIDENQVVRATRNRVVLEGHNTSRASERTVLQAATRGGGPTFVIER